MRTKEAVLEDIKDAKTDLEDYEEAVKDAVREIYKYEEELIPFLTAELKEEIETKTVLLYLRVFDSVEGAYAYKTIKVEAPIKTSAKKVLEEAIRLLRAKGL